jgi:glucosamine-6-phosphate deaminase
MSQAPTGRHLPARAMQLLAAHDIDDLSTLALQIVTATLVTCRDAVISLTTGHTTLSLYSALRDANRARRLDLSRTRFVSSEEYLGIGPDDPLSLFGWLRESVFEPCGIAESAVVRLRGEAADQAAECRRFDAEIETWGGIDLAVQTVGVNGHFGFNEPGCRPDDATRVVELTPSTRASNASYWPSGAQVPAFGLAMGPRTILRARHILLLAAGQAKHGRWNDPWMARSTPQCLARCCALHRNSPLSPTRQRWPMSCAPIVLKRQYMPVANKRCGRLTESSVLAITHRNTDHTK